MDPRLKLKFMPKRRRQPSVQILNEDSILTNGGYVADTESMMSMRTRYTRRRLKSSTFKKRKKPTSSSTNQTTVNNCECDRQPPIKRRKKRRVRNTKSGTEITKSRTEITKPSVRRPRRPTLKVKKKKIPNNPTQNLGSESDFHCNTNDSLPDIRYATNSAEVISKQRFQQQR